MTEKVIKLLKQKHYQIPSLLLHHYKELQLTGEECLVLIYLLNENDIFNPKQLCEHMQLELIEGLELVSSLSTKGMLAIELKEVNKVKEEYFSFEPLYQKLALLIASQKEHTATNTLFDQFEKELGRTLSPMEFEIIGSWTDQGFTEELIITALKEATFNGVHNLRYIDKILFEWHKKGIKSPDEVEKRRRKPNITPKEVFEYDWLNEDE